MEYQCGQRQQPLLSGCPSSKILRPLCLVALTLQFPIYQISFSSFKNHKKGQHGFQQYHQRNDIVFPAPPIIHTDKQRERNCQQDQSCRRHISHLFPALPQAILCLCSFRTSLLSPFSSRIRFEGFGAKPLQTHRS